MRPLLHPTLINGRFGDPAIFVETLFEDRAFLLDLGDIAALPPRKVQRIERIFVSHAHIDHFFGFDRLLRVLVGREKTIHLYGPDGFVECVRHKLLAYRWNLVDRYLSDLALVVTEIDAGLTCRTARFCLKTAFRLEEVGCEQLTDDVIHSEPALRVSTALLEHRTPCLAYAIEEAVHVNVWKNRLADLGLPVGPWLRDLKRAVLEQRPDQHPILVRFPDGGATEKPLGALRHAVTVTPGQKIGYVTDAADTPANREAIARLVRGADLLFIEAVFAAADAALASERAHLTTTAAGLIARAAGVRRLEPFHFSPRYQGQEERMMAEVTAAFAGKAVEKAGDGRL
jgi:ribonuclease Z